MLTLAVYEGEMVSFQRKSTWYPWVRKLGMPQSQSGCVGEEKTLSPY
jgi:hypothetical protein